MTGTILAGPVVRAIQDQKVSPGVLGFLVVAALGVATWLLIRSMGRQIKKIDFSQDAIDAQRPPSAVRKAAATPEPADADHGAGPATTDGDDGAGPASDLR